MPATVTWSVPGPGTFTVNESSAVGVVATVVPASVTDPTQALLASVQTFPLTYQSPLIRVSYRISAKVRWNAAYQFYSYGEQFHLLGYNQNFGAHTGYTSILWAF